MTHFWGGRQEMKEGRERSEKNTLAFLLPERGAHPIFSFFLLSFFQLPELLLLRQAISILNKI
ncbi:hypothetical protein HMPREF0083_04128 [Aneurinibacillus aneurinilyticus ATCC 12856]|uniref:Uncharacterized protein n=2 Tax=Aneurinibacillus aneurinilyticus TaxID=1391 RepID=U1WYQ5_ANEAE|nr:hypothetical protein HMPREF0083_04128 [Aneurinibacillus aneurinilyticus ATCC 12856]